jgi:hypothetical protein
MAAQLGGINSCSSSADALISCRSLGVHRSVEDSCGAQDSRNGHAPDKRERRERVTSSYRRFTNSGSMAPAARRKL